jgi:hypothetical protein
MSEVEPSPEPGSVVKPSEPRRLGPWLAIGSLAVVLALAVGFFLRSGTEQPGPRAICQALEQAGTVSDCRARTGGADHGMPVVEVARFRVSFQGRKAYSGTLARFGSVPDLERYLAAARDDQRAAARKIAAATEIGSGGRTRGEDVLKELVPVQFRNDERLLAVHLVPIYGGPQPGARDQVAAIQAAVSH